jgi:hypothetical protein
MKRWAIEHAPQMRAPPAAAPSFTLAALGDIIQSEGLPGAWRRRGRTIRRASRMKSMVEPDIGSFVSLRRSP